jgi:hypothetical protein
MFHTASVASRFAADRAEVLRRIGRGALAGAQFEGEPPRAEELIRGNPLTGGAPDGGY